MLRYIDYSTRNVLGEQQRADRVVPNLTPMYPILGLFIIQNMALSLAPHCVKFLRNLVVTMNGFSYTVVEQWQSVECQGHLPLSPTHEVT
jgi:hypothetical protein